MLGNVTYIFCCSTTVSLRSQPFPPSNLVSCVKCSRRLWRVYFYSAWLLYSSLVIVNTFSVLIWKSVVALGWCLQTFFGCTPLSVKNLWAHSTKYMHIYLIVVYIHVLLEFYLFFLYLNGLSCAPCGVGAHHSGDHYLRQWPPLMTDNHQVSLQLLMMLQVKGLLRKICWRSLPILSCIPC